MNCREWEERIALYAGGDLAPADAEKVEQHVAGCPDCLTLLSGLRESLEWIRESHAQPVEAAHFAAVRSRVLAEIGGRRRPWWRQAWVYGAAAAAILAMWVAMHPRSKPAASVARVVVAEPVKAPAVAIAPESGRTAEPSVVRRRRPHAQSLTPPATPAETILVKLETNNPDVVIYWIAETKGEPK